MTANSNEHDQQGHHHHHHGENAEQQAGQSDQALTGSQAAGQNAYRVPVVEESLDVQKGQRQAGEVEVRKSVHEEQVNVPVELSHEEVTVSRHAVDRPLQAGEQTLQDGQVLRVPVSEETAQVQKQARVTGEVEINKQRVTEQRNVGDTVRREEVDVQPAGDVEALGH